MAKPANKTLIGLFVVGAIALAIAAVAIFGSGKFLAKRPKFVMFFSGSVNGLTVGSPVLLRGVKVGEVSDIAVMFNPKDLSFTIPVVVEFNPESVSAPKEIMKQMGKYLYFRRIVDKGLKAQLRLKSLITGQLYIDVGFHPETPARFAGLDKRYPEIPTMPSPTEVLMATLEKVPVTEITERLLKVTQGIEKIVNSPDARESMQNLNLSLREVKGLVRGLQAEIKPTAAAARGAFAQAEKTLALKDGEPGKIAGSVQETLVKVNTTLDDVRLTLASYNRIADRNANIGYDLSKTLREIDAAARSIRSLTDYLDRHPEALVKGKKASQGE